MKKLDFKCDLCGKRKPFAEIYSYKGNRNNGKFTGTWSYICLLDFIILKISEKLGKTKYKYAWCRTTEKEYNNMINEIRGYEFE
jgi:hypothetical protein